MGKQEPTPRDRLNQDTELADAKGLLEGTGRVMRHVKLSPKRNVDNVALKKLIEAAYTDMKRRVEQTQE